MNPNKSIAHTVVAKILEDLIVNEKIDEKIPADYEQKQADAIRKEIEAIMNYHVTAGLNFY